MAIEAARTNHELETLRIERPQERPRRQRSPLISIAMLMVLATVLGAAGYLIYAKTIGRPPAVETMMIVARTNGQSGVLLTGSGYIVTRHKYIIIGTKILGQIVDEPIEEGQHIKAGDVLARIDDRDYQAQLRQAIAIRDVAQAELERDEAAVDYAKFNVNQCVITSPINGIVLKKYRELGDTINFGGQIQAGGGATDIAQLADTDDMRAEVDINEADIAKVGIGSPVVVALDSYPDKKFDAALVKVYPAADRQKGTVKIEVQIARPDLQIIKPEMSAKVSFLENQPAATQQPRITVPKGSVRIEEGKTYVWTVREGIVQRVGIVRGQETEAGIEIKQGLNDGDVVVVSSQANLANGRKVSIGTESNRRVK